jgi:hypothetical protein
MRPDPAAYAAWATGAQTDADARAFAQRVYQALPDTFDFVIAVNNQTDAPAGAAYSGLTRWVKNTVNGIGRPPFDQTATYGAAGALLVRHTS